MKKFILAVVAISILTAFTVVNTVWENDDYHSNVGFTVTHLGVNDVSGYFADADILLTAEKADFSDAEFSFTAQANSIDTHVEARNNHLKTADFFDVETYPTLTFKSTKFKKTSKNKYKLIGNLTLHGVTKKVTLNALYRGTVENPMNKKQTAGFQITGVVKRSDFGLGNSFPEAVISDKVQIKVDAEFSPKN